MKLEVWKCDCCGKEYRKGGGESLTLCVGRESGPQGMEDEFDYLDVCESCLAKTVMVMVNQFLKQHEQRKQLAHLIRTDLKKMNSSGTSFV